ncbi:ATP-binding protein [Sphingomonas sp. GC_Shp_6]|uniref:sensor histidine kinase n=2 Tax=unclassified Sphingomonas TaxID=196159 RepID=UPI002269979B|nr:ATP-binding protein [Sphingomonas sp. GC_Shp_6]
MLNGAGRFADSMAGRIFAVLILGIIAAAAVASLLAGRERDAQIAAERADRVADRVVAAIGADPPPPGTRRLERVPPGVPDSALAGRLADRLPGWPSVIAAHVDPALCPPAPPPAPPPPAAPGGVPPPVPAPAPSGAGCYVVRLAGRAGAPVLLAIDAPPAGPRGAPVASRSFLVTLGVVVLLLALIVARMAARPIERFGAAAQDLAANLDADPLVESGPGDVRRAIGAFNDMQVQLRRTLDERTYMLAAISHDLRSPLTRMRLRLEAIADEAVRDKLIADARAMEALIAEGLELARLSNDHGVAFVPVDIGALAASLCEDAQDVGHPVTFDPPAHRLVAPTQPEALRRILANLIDNALLHGGGAEVRLESDGTALRLHVADRGPGIAAADLERVFDPFRRLDAARPSGRGSGLGLTIARLLAHRIGAAIGLADRPGGGLTATVTIPLRRA